MKAGQQATLLLRKLRRQPAFVWLWLAPVWVLLGLSRGLIALVPFRRLAPMLGVNTGVDPWVPVVSPQQTTRAQLIARTVRIAARCAPWESNCYPQAVTARLLLGLNRIPFALFLGVARAPGQALRAHAWGSAGATQVTGEQADFDDYTVVGCFVTITDREGQLDAPSRGLSAAPAHGPSLVSLALTWQPPRQLHARDFHARAVSLSGSIRQRRFARAWAAGRGACGSPEHGQRAGHLVRRPMAAAQ